MHRRTFVKNSIACAWGAAAVGNALVGPRAHASSRGDPDTRPNIIGPRPGFSPQIGTLLSMLDWMRPTVLASVKDLTSAQLDYLHDAKANTIGALLLHLAATERLYQIHTFEGKKWGAWDEETKQRWLVPMNLGKDARESIQGHELSFYLDALAAGRDRTRAEFRKRDDAWLMQVDPDWPWGPTNNYCKWFHVCEHESHHDGQIKWIKGRLPGKADASE